MIAKDFPSRRFSIGSRKSFTIMEGGQANAGTERNNVGLCAIFPQGGIRVGRIQNGGSRVADGGHSRRTLRHAGTVQLW
jgi:hypothetical protein